MKLDAYRSCSRQEKRQVLDAFWRTNAHPSPRILEAASEYAPYALACLTTVALELLVVTIVSIHRAPIIAWLAIVLGAVDILSLWWAVVRFRAIKSEGAAVA